MTSFYDFDESTGGMLACITTSSFERGGGIWGVQNAVSGTVPLGACGLMEGKTNVSQVKERERERESRCFPCAQGVQNPDRPENIGI